MNCIFCKIVKEEIPTKFIYKDKDFAVFYDIKPKAPLHLLIIPKKHIEKLENEKLLGKMIILTTKLAKKFKVDKGYRLQFNIGKKAGQEISHLHLHLLGF